MKKIIIFMVLLVSLFFSFNVAVKAEEEERSCSYTEKAELNKIASNVEVASDIVIQEDGNPIIKISIYNITDAIYVNIVNDSKSEPLVLTVVPNDTVNGAYSFDVANITDIIKYTFTIRSTNSACSNDIRKISFVKPKRNKYHDYDVCKYTDTEDYVYCKEWITRDFNLTEETIVNKINEQRESLKKIKTTKCVDCAADARYLARLNQVKMYKRYIVIGLSIGIVIDMIYLYLKVSTIRRSEL